MNWLFISVLTFSCVYALCKIIRLVNVLRLIHYTHDYPSAYSTDHVNIRIFGDSVAKGVGTSHFSHSFCGQMRAHFPSSTVDCRASSGQFMDQTVRMLNNKQYTQDIAVLFSGSMDVMYKTTQRYTTIFEELLDHLAGCSQHVVVFVPSNAGKVRFFPYVIRLILHRRSLALETAILTAARSRSNVHVINLIESGGRDLAAFDSRYFSSDAIHPNDHSFDEWSKKLAHAIEEANILGAKPIR